MATLGSCGRTFTQAMRRACSKRTQLAPRCLAKANVNVTACASIVDEKDTLKLS